nr:hypothetical protein [Tanacetum cinerariifolium]
MMMEYFDDELKEISDDDIFEDGEDIHFHSLLIKKPDLLPQLNNHPLNYNILNKLQLNISLPHLTMITLNHPRVLAKTLQGFLEVQYARVAEDNLDDVKEDPALNKKVLEAAKAYTKNSLSLTKLLTLVTDFDFPGFNSTIKSLQAAVTAQNDHLTRWTKSFASLAWNVGRRMTRIKNTQATIKSDIVSL